jgi:exodeoxyribonuclease VII small subunit
MKDNPLAQDVSEPGEPSFEKTFIRLEEILEKMNSGNLSLDESLTFFEEADKLIASCNKKLNDAERKIETLIKNRNGELTQGSDQRPLTQECKWPSPNTSK